METADPVGPSAERSFGREAERPFELGAAPLAGGRLAVAKRRANFIMTALGLRQKGFFTPYDWADQAAPAHYPEIRPVFDARRAAFADFIDLIARQQTRFRRFDSGVVRPSWTSRFISPLDGAAIYTGIVKFRPRRVIEIGCGNSTRFMLRAITDHGLDCEVTCINPDPRVEIASLDVTVVRRVFSPRDLALTRALGPNDILFVDSSHILQQGYDLDIILNRVFPSLAPGVVVHVHDIFLPYGYPPHWTAFRFNEQNALAGWLVSRYFDIAFASHYALRDMADNLAHALRDFPAVASGNGGTLWLRKA